MCGEQSRRIARQLKLSGSPPRVRGTEPAAPPAICARGITPACAGNSFPELPRRRRRSDHPRVCGEQFRRRWSITRLAGSPPRVRGTGLVVMPRGASGRITPACAGNSFGAFLSVENDQDHPRVCGEQLLL